MWRKLISLRYWGHIFTRVYRLIKSPQIPLGEKLLFLIPALVYWVMPDVMPFIPVDDIVVSMFLANWFAQRMENKYKITDNDRDGVIDVEIMEPRKRD